jgi:FkbM family methyltransferase
MRKEIRKRGIAFTVNASEPSLPLRFWQALQAFGTTFANFSFWDRVARGSYEPWLFEILDRFLDPEHSCLDIGAWIGPFSLYACQRARRCYAVEPDPVAFAALESNVALNPLLASRITLHRGAIWSESGGIPFGSSSTFGDSMSSGHFTKSFLTIQVPSLTIEDFLSTYGITDLGFIKMDIEAGETVVLPAMKEFLSTAKTPMLVSLHPLWFPDLQADTRRILDALSCYRHLYSRAGRLLEPGWIERRLRSRLIMDILATDRSW